MFVFPEESVNVGNCKVQLFNVGGVESAIVNGEELCYYYSSRIFDIILNIKYGIILFRIKIIYNLIFFIPISVKIEKIII